MQRHYFVHKGPSSQGYGFPVVMYRCEILDCKLSAKELMLLKCGVGEDSWESLGLQGDPTSPSLRKSALNIHWKDWCWNWNSNTLATLWEELTHLKIPRCWERLRLGGAGDDRGWDGWMASLTQCTWVWVNSGSWWRTRRPSVLQSLGSQSRTWLSDWTELDWTIHTVHGILQPRILEWVASAFSRGSSQPRDQTQVSRIAGRFFTS